MTHIVRPFSHLEILDVHGKPRTMESLCKDSPLVIGFVRHFGCALCEEQVIELARAKSEFERHSGRLVIIGNGNPEHARNFTLRTGVHDVYTDPARVVYRAFELKHSIRGTFGLRAARSTLRAFRKGHRQGAFEGDPWQQGGTFVLEGQRIVYAHRSEFAGDHARIGDVVSAVEAVALRARG